MLLLPWVTLGGTGGRCCCLPVCQPDAGCAHHLCALQCGAGGTSTFCVATGPQLYAWGKLKVSGDNATHPMPLEDLSGWNVSVQRLV